MAGLLESRLWRDAHARSLRNKGLEVKSLLFFDLEPLPLPVGAPGWALLLRPGVGPPFRPDQKVKLDKRDATRGGLSLDGSPRGMTSVRCQRHRGPLLEKREKWGTPTYFAANIVKTDALY
jgi:hypothetical protein